MVFDSKLTQISLPWKFLKHDAGKFLVEQYKDLSTPRPTWHENYKRQTNLHNLLNKGRTNYSAPLICFGVSRKRFVPTNTQRWSCRRRLWSCCWSLCRWVCTLMDDMCSRWTKNSVTACRHYRFIEIALTGDLLVKNLKKGVLSDVDMALLKCIAKHYGKNMFFQIIDPKPATAESTW